MTTWQAFREQTGSILSANMWGMAMTGADICGYGIEGATGMTDAERQELCTR
jgi:alpha-glucosidase (family GH31 glycosyl hydrolase)